MSLVNVALVNCVFNIYVNTKFSTIKGGGIVYFSDSNILNQKYIDYQFFLLRFTKRLEIKAKYLKF